MIRDYRESDRTACAAIFAHAWTQAFPHQPRHPDTDAFDRETEEETIRVAVSGETVLGFASLYPPDAFLHHLYVEPGAQQSGVGAALLNNALARASSTLSLKCQISNTRAMDFYTKRGFAERERGESELGAWVKLYAPDPVSAITPRG